MNVTAAVCVTVTLSVESVAVYVTASALVLFTVNVASPLLFVVPDTVVIVELPVPCASVTVLSLTGLPFVSFNVTVMVDVAVPFASTEEEEAATVEFAAVASFTSVMVIVNALLYVSPAASSVWMRTL